MSKVYLLIYLLSLSTNIFGGVVLGCGETRMGKVPALPSRGSQANEENRGKEQWRVCVQGVQSRSGGVSSGLASNSVSWLLGHVPFCPLKVLVQGPLLCHGGALFPDSVVQEELVSLEA